MVTGLSINQKTDTNLTIPDLNVRNSLSVMIRSYKEGRKKSNLNCRFYKHDLFDITIPLKKRTDVLTTGYTYFYTTTSKIKTIQLTITIVTLKILVFKWKKQTVWYKITLPADQNQIEKKKWCKYIKVHC